MMGYVSYDSVSCPAPPVLFYFREQNPLLTTCPNFGDHLISQ
jgi:hypothetical protein